MVIQTKPVRISRFDHAACKVAAARLELTVQETIARCMRGDSDTIEVVRDELRIQGYNVAALLGQEAAKAGVQLRKSDPVPPRDAEFLAAFVGVQRADWPEGFEVEIHSFYQRGYREVGAGSAVAND